jgi:hypothetical protein
MRVSITVESSSEQVAATALAFAGHERVIGNGNISGGTQKG